MKQAAMGNIYLKGKRKSRAAEKKTTISCSISATAEPGNPAAPHSHIKGVAALAFP